MAVRLARLDVPGHPKPEKRPLMPRRSGNPLSVTASPPPVGDDTNGTAWATPTQVDHALSPESQQLATGMEVGADPSADEVVYGQYARSRRQRNAAPAVKMRTSWR